MPVFVLFARRPYSGGKVVQQPINISAAMKQDECTFHISFTARKTMVHCTDLLFVSFVFRSSSRQFPLPCQKIKGGTVVRDVFFRARTVYAVEAASLPIPIPHARPNLGECLWLAQRKV
jgi:hypothetical protein